MKSLAVIVACLLLALAGAPARAADAAQGKILAQRWCASCHLVAPEQKQASADVPPFATIGRDPKFDAAHLAFFLLDPHPKMPDMQLTRSEAQDLAAYIVSLK